MKQPSQTPPTVTAAVAVTVFCAVVAAARAVAVVVVTDWALVGTLVTVVVVGLLLASAAVFGQRQAWARLVVLVWSVISSISSAVTLAAWTEPGWYLATAALTLMGAGALVVLLLHPEARDWFRAD